MTNEMRVAPVELKPCPFCNCKMALESNRDWHRIVGEHDEECMFLERETCMVPATDDQLAIAVNDWNRRAQPADQQGEALRARVCGYTPGKSSVELRLDERRALPQWLELGEPVTVRRHTQPATEGVDDLLRRALPYLSDTPDLVQSGAEELAAEIRAKLNGSD
jgi:hypothetical protein